jgi:hypothetical protein
LSSFFNVSAGAQRVYRVFIPGQCVRLAALVFTGIGIAKSDFHRMLRSAGQNCFPSRWLHSGRGAGQPHTSRSYVVGLHGLTTALALPSFNVMRRWHHHWRLLILDELLRVRRLPLNA